MPTNLMKSFINPEISVTGKKLLAFQFEGSENDSFWNLLRDHGVIGYAMPDGHTFQAAWLFRLICDGDMLIEFSSACTRVLGWQEVGTLNIRLMCRACEEPYDECHMPLKIVSPAIPLKGIEKLVYEDDDVITECGLVLCGLDGKEIVIAAGISPGSVSVAATFAEGKFEPQFPLSMCKRESMVSKTIT